VNAAVAMTLGVAVTVCVFEAAALFGNIDPTKPPTVDIAVAIFLGFDNIASPSDAS
jgi:hypothetical protein